MAINFLKFLVRNKIKFMVKKTSNTLYFLDVIVRLVSVDSRAGFGANLQTL